MQAASSKGGVATSFFDSAASSTTDFKFEIDGTTPTIGAIIGATAVPITIKSPLNMDSNPVTNLLSLDSSTVLSLGGTSALGINIGRAEQTTDLKGNLQINSSAGTAGQVLTSGGADLPPTWQTAAAGGGGSSSLSYFKSPTNTSFLGLNTNNIYNPITLTPSSVSATYLLSANMVVGANGSNVSLISFSFASQLGGTINTSSSAKNLIDNSIINNSTKMTSSNCVTQQQTYVAGYSSVSWTMIYTPATTAQTTFGIFMSIASGSSLRQLSNFHIIRLTD